MPPIAGRSALPLHLPLPLGAPNIGGSMVTAGGVIFIAATQDQYFRAVDESDRQDVVGREASRRRPCHADDLSGRDGRQYVLIAAGGNTSFGTQPGDDFIAYRLKP